MLTADPGRLSSAAGWAGVEGAAALGVKVGAEGLKTGADGLKAGTFGLSLVGVAATAGALPAAAAGVEDIGSIDRRTARRNRTAGGLATQLSDGATVARRCRRSGAAACEWTVQRCR